MAWISTPNTPSGTVYTDKVAGMVSSHAIRAADEGEEEEAAVMQPWASTVIEALV
jgi:hypothetical protein